MSKVIETSEEINEGIEISNITLQEGIAEFKISFRGMSMMRKIHLNEINKWDLDRAVGNLIKKYLYSVVDYDLTNIYYCEENMDLSIRVGVRYTDITPIESLILRLSEES